MNIIQTQYTLSHKSLDIYIAGCSGNPHCKDCHNPESWNFDIGEDYRCYEKFIMNKLLEFDSMIDNVMIFGGEPLDQNIDDLLDFLSFLKAFNKKIWLFTRFELEDIPKNIVEICDYIKTGRYDKNKICDNNICYGIKLATSNQKITKKGESKNEDRN